MLVNLNDVLYEAQRNKYAVGLFNTIDSDAVEAAISAAEELNSPIVIGTAEVLLPYGELELIAPVLVRKAKKTKVPVVVNFDHGLTFGRCMEALKLGFSSIMFDGSAGSVEENLKNTREMVKIAHSLGASVEGEIGHVGETDTGDHEDGDMYTKPEQAASYVERTGVDALAVAIGTAHGVYTSKPKLDIERLKQIRAALDTPLVLHGGSGLTDDDFKNVIQNGIAKVNIFTDLYAAGLDTIKNFNGDYLSIRNAKVEAIKQVVMHKIILFGSENRA